MLYTYHVHVILYANKDDDYYNTPSIYIFKQLNILPLNKLGVNKIVIRMYKYANNVLPLAINDLFITNSDVHNYITR